MPRALTSLAVAVAIATAVACGKTSSTTVAGPSPAKCQLTATNSTPSFSASGGKGAIVVQAARECAWTAAAQATWVALLPPAEGQGDSTLSYTVQPNASGLPRRGTVNVAGQLVEVGQEGAPCRFELDRPSVQVGAAVATVDVAVGGPVGCAWTAASEVPWITVVQGTQGSGPGQVTLRIAQIDGAARTGVVLIAGVRFTVTQTTLAPPPGCTYSLQPASMQVAAAGGEGILSLTTGGECPWTATSDQPWLSVTSATSGTGSAQIAYRADANDTAVVRTGLITVGTAIFTLEQAAGGAGCAFTVTPTDTIVASAGGSAGTISVSTTATCAWTAAPSDPWIALSTQGETGSGQVAYTIDPNPEAGERTGSITVAGTTIAVLQNGTGAEPVTVSGDAADVSGSCPWLTFTVNGRTVSTSNSTTYKSGSCSKLKNGDTIIVRGFLTALGTIDASEIEFRK